ncbi:MAG: dihydrodipicolinate reductase [Christensenellaceae bacterium]|jgi:4-hydroxy-tetrahydrodipicolinate reductase|nr:dihydrodipicolinate reductase [Christensenellaceae bacterium]
MKKITMVQYGCGKMSAYTMRYAAEKGIKIVGGFDIDPKVVGKDIMEIHGQKKYGVKIQDAKEFDNFLKKNQPDIAIITTMSLLKDVHPAFEICAKNGVNAISICEESFFPQNSNPGLFARLNTLAQANNCTLCGSGYQDVFWGNLITVLAGATHTIKKIKGKSSYNVEDYGIALARAHGAGLSLKDFEKEIAAADNISEKERQKLIENGEFLPSYMWNVNGWLCSQLGLTIKNQTQKCLPQIAKKDIKSTTLGITIPKGSATGMSAVVTTTTKEGITLETECIGKVYDETEFDANDWTIEGEPTTRVVIERPSTVELTCATVINRIPEVMAAPPGFFTTEKLPANEIRFGDINDYIEECACEGDCNCH